MIENGYSNSLFLGLGKSGAKDVVNEVASRNSIGLTQKEYSEKELHGIIGSKGYSAGVRYSETYGVCALQYVQGARKILMENGIQVYESTEVKHITDHTAFTHAGSVTADKIIVAIDKMDTKFNSLAKEVFHAQTFLSISEPLSNHELKELFPSGEQFQCWDSSLVYTYFRLTGNNRLLLGGGTALSTFSTNYHNKPDIMQSVIKNFKAKFPYLKDLSFIQYWPGLIDTTRDLLPTVIHDRTHSHLHFVIGAVGLPWASFCGSFVAKNILEDASAYDERYYEYFSNRRHFFLPTWLEPIIGKPLLFSINNGWAKYYQVDTKRLFTRDDNDF
jgi:gamma-glutamylputrescine oxidase